MANQELLNVLNKVDVDVWNRWRKGYSILDLSGANLEGRDLPGSCE